MSSAPRPGPAPPPLEPLLAEQRRRWRQGERVPVEAYLGRQPALRDSTEAVLHLIFNEVVLREQDGEAPGLDEYRARFPQLAAELEVQFAVDGALRAGLLAPATAAARTRTSPASAAPAPAGRPSVPGYDVLAELGRGGMGVVYLARQTGLGRLVALKMILSGAHAGPDELARFRNEAEAVARLQHPHVVQIHQVGEHEGRPYLALEYVAGGSLERKLAGTPQPAREAAALIETLARAVHHAHQRGIVHRDLKPANVLLSLVPGPSSPVAEDKGQGTRDKGLVPKITDFGLAKQLAGGGGTLTHSGQLLGTPDYMAPEQAGGGAKRVGPAADVYALGAILYECLTGRPPFRGETLQETLLQVLTADPVPPSRLRPTTPRDLETVALKCLAREPARRYASAADLADDLRRFLAGEPTVARPLSRAGRLWRWCRRNPAVAGLSSVLLLTLLGGVIALTALYLHARGQQQLAEARARDVATERDRAEENFRLALGAVEKYLTSVGDSEELKAHNLERLRRRLLADAQAFYERFVRDRAGDPALLADLARAYGRLGYIGSQLGDNAQAVELFGRARELFEKLVADHPGDAEYQELLASTLNNRGNARRLNGQWADAEADLTAARERFEQLRRGHADSPKYAARVALTCRSLADLYHQRGPRDAQEKCAREAVAICTELAGQYPEAAEYRAEAADSLRDLGLVLSKTGRPDDAEKAYQEARRTCQRLAEEHGDVLRYRGALARCHLDLGLFYYNAGRFPQAQAACLAARQLLAELVHSHPAILSYAKEAADNELNFGVSCLARSQWKEAATAAEEARQGYARLLEADPASPTYQLGLASAWINLGNVAYVTRELPKAEAAYAKARQTLETLTHDHSEVPDHHAYLAMTLLNLGAVHYDQGHHADAESAYLKAREEYEALAGQYGSDGDKRHRLAITHLNLAELYATTERPDKAESAYDQACRLLGPLSHDNPGNAALAVDLALAYSSRGGLALRRKRPEEAHAWHTKAISILEAVLQKDPGNATAGGRLCEAHEGRAEAAARLGRRPEADKDWERALQLGGAGRRDAIRLRRALALARLGEHARSAAEVADIAGKKGLTGETHYDLACVYSLSSAAASKDARLATAERAALAERYARLAVDALATARAEGHFKTTPVVEHLKRDTDIDPLRARDDFKKLLAELESATGAPPK